MKIRAGVIGLGVGEAHIEGYNSHPDCEVVALCDLSKDRLKEAQRRYPHVKTTIDADDILKDPDVDVVSIASYDDCHYKQVVKAISNDKHIFVEKPICLYEGEALHIRRLLDEKPLIKVSSNLILRKSPRFIILKRMIEEGRFGEVYYVEGDYNYGRLQKITDGWRGRIDFYSVVYGGGIHMVDLLMWLAKDRIVEVAAYGNNISTKRSAFRYDDMVVAILKFKGGAVGKVAVNFGCVAGHFHGLSVYGTKASFVNDIEYGRLYESRGSSEFKKIDEPYPAVHKGGLIGGFLDSIINGGQCDVSKEDIFNSMSVCFAIEKAIKRSGAVAVKYI